MHCPACCPRRPRSRQGTPRHSLQNGAVSGSVHSLITLPFLRGSLQGGNYLSGKTTEDQGQIQSCKCSLLKITRLWAEVSHTAARTAPRQRETPGWRAQRLRPELGTGRAGSIPAPHIVLKATKSDPEHQARSTPCALQGVQQQGAPCTPQSTALDLTALPERGPHDLTRLKSNNLRKTV